VNYRFFVEAIGEIFFTKNSADLEMPDFVWIVVVSRSPAQELVGVFIK
jgi:hypothetical protein